jgi:hypothetical protein
MNHFTRDNSVESKKYEHDGQLKVKFILLFYGDNSWAVALTQIQFGIAKAHSHAYKFYLNKV